MYSVYVDQQESTYKAGSFPTYAAAELFIKEQKEKPENKGKRYYISETPKR